MKIRNPFGSDEWRGWEMDDPRWTQELKEVTKCEEQEEGIFFIDIESYKDEFLLSTICFVNDSYHNQSMTYSNDSD